MDRTSQRGLAVIAFLAVGLAGCLDMDTVNVNQPDADRALARADDVETLLGGSYVGLWQFKQLMEPSQMLVMAAEEQTSGWGNWCYNCMSRYPRTERSNNLGSGGADQGSWNRLYRALSSVNDALRQQANGMDFGPSGANNARGKAFGRFVQGLALGYAGVLFDKALIIDETVIVDDGVPDFSPAADVFAAGLAFLDESIAISKANTFTLPDSWINGVSMSSAELGRVASSYAARLLSSMPRRPQERAAVDWNRVIAYIDNGITQDYAPIGNASNWYDALKYYGYSQIWQRTHYNVIGPSDTTGAYEEWYNVGLTNPTARQEILIHGMDRRVNGAEFLSPGTDFFHYGRNNFAAGAPSYVHSRYLPNRYSHQDRLGPMVALSVTEMDLLKAEAYYHLGQRNLTADLINKTRVARGGLQPVTADDPNLLAKLIYEKRIETYAVNGILAFTDARGWGFLWEGTPLEFPVPGRELELLGYTEAYSFGGQVDGTKSSAEPRSIRPLAY